MEVVVMLKKTTLLATLLCSTLMLLAPVARSEESLDFELIPQQTLLNYLAGKEKFTLIDARSAEEYLGRGARGA
jgi:3-mercaptopyruvate sulfurtransferase SseA